MNYQEFLQRYQYQDSPIAKYEFEKQFGGAENLGLGPQIELADRGVHGRLMSNPSEVLYSTEGQEGSNFLVATDRYHNEFPLSGALENYEAPEEELVNPWVDTSDTFSYHPLTGEAVTDPSLLGPGGGSSPQLDYPYANYSISGDDYSYSPAGGPVPAESSGLLGSTAASPSTSASPVMYGSPHDGTGVLAESASESGAESSWGGPQAFAANMALNMIPTRDRQKVNTPIGDEGSFSGMVKGTGKGALVGATIGSAVAPGPGTGVGALIGGGAGFLGATQGYFDSTTPPLVQIARIKQRGGGMPQGLLGGGSIYG